MEKLRELSELILTNNEESNNEENKLKDKKYSKNSRFKKIVAELNRKKIKNRILVMGINPSESNTGNADENVCEREDDYLEYIPEASKELKAYLNSEKLISSKYFGNHYELFCNAIGKENVKMTWTLVYKGREYIKKNENDEKLKKLNAELKALNENQQIKKNDTVLIFSDLILYHNKNQADIKNKIKEIYSKKQEKLKENVNKMLNEQIKLFNPQLIVVTNAYASDLIRKANSTNENDTVKDMIMYKFKDKYIPIIFSGMVSGKRGIDKYSFIRLKDKIRIEYDKIKSPKFVKLF